MLKINEGALEVWTDGGVEEWTKVDCPVIRMGSPVWMISERAEETIAVNQTPRNTSSA